MMSLLNPEYSGFNLNVQTQLWVYEIFWHLEIRTEIYGGYLENKFLISFVTINRFLTYRIDHSSPHIYTQNLLLGINYNLFYFTGNINKVDVYF